MRFANRVVIVTGAAKGIGEGCARVFCREGGAVAIFDIDDIAGCKLAEELSTAGPGRAAFYACDMRQPDQIRSAVTQVVADFGRLDCLVNNAGWHPPALTIDETKLETVEDQLRLNFVSTFLASQAAVPHLRKTQGTIVSISSMTAVLGQEHSTAYAASKAAQLGFTKSLAIELGPDNVRVNAILPSHVDTPLLQAWAKTLPDPAAGLERAAKVQVLGRMAGIEEIGRVALFLASEDSSYITGESIQVEGGASLDY
jgi:NAD(P)-dependent dehydrogenase (short-subunit alcohol dehydrogenase family)